MSDTILIGPSHGIKTPDAIPATAHDVDYLIEPGRYAVGLRAVNWRNVTIESVNDSQPATLVNLQNREFGLFQNMNGSATLRNLKIEFGGCRGVLAQTHNDASLRIDNVVLNTGCLYWGSGGGDVSITSSYSTGKPWKYFVCNFDHRLRSITFDNSMLPPMLQQLWQGPAEALIRFMQTDQGYFRSIVTVWACKQEFQLRSGGKFCLEDCVATQVALGWLEDQKIPAPLIPIQLVQFIRGQYARSPDISSTQKPVKVSYAGTVVNGATFSTN